MKFTLIRIGETPECPPQCDEGFYVYWRLTPQHCVERGIASQYTLHWHCRGDAEELLLELPERQFIAVAELFLRQHVESAFWSQTKPVFVTAHVTYTSPFALPKPPQSKMPAILYKDSKLLARFDAFCNLRGVRRNPLFVGAFVLDSEQLTGVYAAIVDDLWVFRWEDAGGWHRITYSPKTEKFAAYCFSSQNSSQTAKD